MLEAQVRQMITVGGRMCAREMQESDGQTNKIFKINRLGEKVPITYGGPVLSYTGGRDQPDITSSGFYVAALKNNPTFDSFLYDADARIATLIQVTTGRNHGIKTSGLDLVLQKLPRGTTLRYLAVLPSDHDLTCTLIKTWRGTMKMLWLMLTPEEVGHARMEQPL